MVSLSSMILHNHQSSSPRIHHDQLCHYLPESSVAGGNILYQDPLGLMIIVVSSTCRIHFNHNVFMPQDLLQTWCHHPSASMRIRGVPGPMIPNHIITSQDPFQPWCHHLPGPIITITSPPRTHDTQICHHFSGSISTIVSSPLKIHDTKLCHHLLGFISTMVSSSAGIRHNHDIITSQDP